MSRVTVASYENSELRDASGNIIEPRKSASLVGTFQVRARAARTGRNPQTGEAIEVAAANIPSFKAGKSLKDAVN